MKPAPSNAPRLLPMPPTTVPTIMVMLESRLKATGSMKAIANAMPMPDSEASAALSPNAVAFSTCGFRPIAIEAMRWPLTASQRRPRRLFCTASPIR